jgi:hypothetical protein
MIMNFLNTSDINFLKFKITYKKINAKKPSNIQE